MLAELDGAIEELSWRFGRAAADLGIKGQSYTEGGQHVFDTSEDLLDVGTASARAHLRKRAHHHRRAVQRTVRIDATLAEAGPFVARRAAFIFTPYGRVSRGLSSYLTSERVCLVPLVAEALTDPAELAWLDANVDVDAKTSDPRPKNAKVREVLDRLRRDAVAVTYAVLSMYEPHRQKRVEQEREERQAARTERDSAFEEGRAEREEHRLARQAEHVKALAGLRALREAPAVVDLREQLKARELERALGAAAE